MISLRLTHPTEMFELPQHDLFSEYRNFLTGIDFCISELRSHFARGPVRIEIELPEDEITEHTARRIARTLVRYCDNRITYNGREKRAVRFDGLTAFRIGLPVALLGVIMTIASVHMEEANEATKAVFDHLGWVLAWLGLWFPLDTLLFFPHAYTRENGVLRCLRDAEVVVTPYELLPNH